MFYRLTILCLLCSLSVFFNSQGPFLYMFIFPVCGLFIIPGYWHLINFNYELFATVGGLACFPVGSFLINSYAARA